MKRRMKRTAAAMLFAAAVSGGIGAAVPARAQTIPAVPIVGPAISGCAALAGLSPCLVTVVPVAPVILPGLGGDRNVAIAKDVDRSRTPGRVVIVQ